MYQALHPVGAGPAPLPLWKAVLCIFLPSLVAFVALDGIWIGLVANDFYMSR
jgi:uncharacterized membrane protein YhdT